PLRIAVIGCGLIGARRARTARDHARTRLAAVADPDAALARAASAGVAEIGGEWRAIVERDDVDAVVVSTPNALLAEIVVAALEAGKHVLMEKPMGRSLAEAERIADATARSGSVLRVGFNHRFHPALRRAQRIVRSGELGRLITLRARYGHGGRPGLENEWRSDPAQAGGGELIDQGVHIADLLHWLAGMPAEAFAYVQTAAWPIAPLEDNAYGLLRFPNGAVGQLHASMTQWKNLFSLEVHGEAGAVVVEGLGGSYGVERLQRIGRALEGGSPVVREERFDGEDRSWTDEWAAFVAAIDGAGAEGAGASEGIAAMRIIDALYRSSRSGTPVAV
ncbi:MAG: Gfo/Idh/MocA family protein, partial [Longimicrobiales bacterium]